MNTERGETLLRIARNSIAETLGAAAFVQEPAGWLDEPGASFVTLMYRGELRGCIGTLITERKLCEDVAANARAAAFHDPRFPPVTLEEYRELAVEVSLLSSLEPIHCKNESHLLSQLRPGMDGVLIEHGWRRGTFLPQVWEQLPEPKAFLAHLKQKTGLPADFWDDEIKISRYTVSKWRENKP